MDIEISFPGGKRVARITIEVRVPPDFPERYREGVAHAAAACKVKKTLADPPAFDVITVSDADARPGPERSHAA